MGFFGRLLGRESKKHSPAVAARAAEVRNDIEVRRKDDGIRYDPQLVDKLKDDHQTLFRIYGDLVKAKDRDDFKNVPRLLGDFKLALQTHLMVENVRFYVYLQQQFAADSDTSAFIADLRKEMDGIARTAVKFVNTYAIADDYSPQMKRDFGANLAAIGDVLTKRVALEESRLYTLYQSS